MAHSTSSPLPTAALISEEDQILHCGYGYREPSSTTSFGGGVGGATTSSEDSISPHTYPAANGAAAATQSTAQTQNELSGSDYCLFIANLPQRMTNEELAIALFSLFKPFGGILSVKASRDQRGRPYGFVEFASEQGATMALAYGPHLTLDSRRIRVEQAKRQRKLCIKYRFGKEEALEVTLERVRKALQTLVPDEDFKLSIQSSAMESSNSLFLNSPTATDAAFSSLPQDTVAAVIKFDSVERARQVQEQLRDQHPHWTMTWINMDRSALGSNIRNSGLVQLVPAKDGALSSPPNVVLPGVMPNVMSSVMPSAAPNTMPNVMPHSHNTMPNTMPHSHLTMPRYASPPYYSMPTAECTSPVAIMPGYSHVCFEEAEYDCLDESTSIIRKMSCLSIDEEEGMDNWIGSTLFVGRLNGQQASLELLKERFAAYGPIAYIRLYNRGVVGFDGVPLDAYAFIKYHEECGDSGSGVEAARRAVEAAIASEHGRVWLGQAIKCEHARISALGALIRNAMESRLYQQQISSPLLKSTFIPPSHYNTANAATAASHSLFYYQPATIYPTQNTTTTTTTKSNTINENIL